ncbi:MAG: hypothetical protein V7647_2702 [Acidobacteriota bacterium]|jgi:hypothetical protein
MPSLRVRWRLAAAGVAVSVVLLAIPARGAPPVFRNAGKYGAMFSWWYDALPPQTVYPPTLPWDARDQKWWNTIVRQGTDAGLGWLAAACWGQGSSADPAMLRPLLRAIDANGGRMKVALFDDTTSEVLRKNQERHGVWALSPRFDLADPAEQGEGGFRYFYDEQWKRFFATVPDRYRLKINGRPVVIMWHGGFEWYSNGRAFHTLVQDLREATRREFQTDPFVIVEESWSRLDPALVPDAMYDWFETGKNWATLTEFGGVHVANIVPGYDTTLSETPGRVIDRQRGALFRAGMDAVAPRADLVLIEGFVNVDENAHLVETTTWGRLYLNLVRWYARNVP